MKIIGYARQRDVNQLERSINQYDNVLVTVVEYHEYKTPVYRLTEAEIETLKALADGTARHPHLGEERLTTKAIRMPKARITCGLYFWPALKISVEPTHVCGMVTLRQ